MSIFKRRGGWAHEYEDIYGKPHRFQFATKREAEDDRERRIRLGEIRRGHRRLTFSDPTVSEYHRDWIALIGRDRERDLAPSTVETYGYCFRVHILPHIGHMKVRDLDPMGVRNFFSTRLSPSLSENTRRLIRNALSSMFADATLDGLIAANPVILPRRRRGKALRLSREPLAFTAEERQLFLAASGFSERRYYLLFLLISRTGLRPGEALALRVQDLDLVAGTVYVANTYSRRRIGRPKDREPRTVVIQDDGILENLRRHIIESKEEALKLGVSAPTLLFPRYLQPRHPNEVIRPISTTALAQAFARVLAAAGLPTHHTPKSLRHTYARLMLERGESLEYISQQMGHSSIKITYDTYAHWARLKPRNPNALADLAGI